MTSNRMPHGAPLTEIATFLAGHFGGQSGWLCLGRIEGDPRNEPMRETWFELPRQVRAAVQCAETLAECGFNLYVAPCLCTVSRA